MAWPPYTAGKDQRDTRPLFRTAVARMDSVLADVGGFQYGSHPEDAEGGCAAESPAFIDAAMPSASVARVSSGSITPSSQSRALAK